MSWYRGWRNGWPLRILAWKALHNFVNGLAWRFARPPGPDWGIADRIDRMHPLWRLNDWLAPHWSDWWLRNRRSLR